MAQNNTKSIAISAASDMIVLDELTTLLTQGHLFTSFTSLTDTDWLNSSWCLPHFLLILQLITSTDDKTCKIHG